MVVSVTCDWNFPMDASSPAYELDINNCLFLTAKQLSYFDEIEGVVGLRAYSFDPIPAGLDHREAVRYYTKVFCKGGFRCLPANPHEETKYSEAALVLISRLHSQIRHFFNACFVSFMDREERRLYDRLREMCARLATVRRDFHRSTCPRVTPNKPWFIICQIPAIAVVMLSVQDLCYDGDASVRQSLHALIDEVIKECERAMPSIV